MSDCDSTSCKTGEDLRTGAHLQRCTKILYDTVDLALRLRQVLEKTKLSIFKEFSTTKLKVLKHSC